MPSRADKPAHEGVQMFCCEGQAAVADAIPNDPPQNRIKLAAHV